MLRVSSALSAGRRSPPPTGGLNAGDLSDADSDTLDSLGVGTFLLCPFRRAGCRRAFMGARAFERKLLHQKECACKGALQRADSQGSGLDDDDCSHGSRKDSVSPALSQESAPAPTSPVLRLEAGIGPRADFSSKTLSPAAAGAAASISVTTPQDHAWLLQRLTNVIGDGTSQVITKVANIETMIGQLTLKVNAMNEKVDAHEGRIDELETAAVEAAAVGQVVLGHSVAIASINAEIKTLRGNYNHVDGASYVLTHLTSHSLFLYCFFCRGNSF